MSTYSTQLYCIKRENMQSGDAKMNYVTDTDNLAWVNEITGHTMYAQQHSHDAFQHKIKRDEQCDLVFEGWPLVKSKGYNDSYNEYLTLYQTKGGTLVCERITTLPHPTRHSPSRNKAITTLCLDEVKAFFGMTKAAKALYEATAFLNPAHEMID